MAPEDLLLAARDVMRERGLARFTFEDGNGAVCLAGAVMVASRGADERAEECQGSRALSAIGAVCTKRYAVGISSANDSCIASVDEACDVLEAAAKRAASKGVGDE